MQPSWTTFAMADVATIQGGGTPSRKENAYFGGDLPWVTPTDLAPIGRVELLGQVSQTLTAEGLANSSARLIPAGSVLFSSRASIGKIAVTDRDCATNQGFINLSPKPDVICPWFLGFLLSYKTTELVKLAGKTTFLEIPRGKFKNYEITIPPISEQRRIVARLKDCIARVDEIQRLRALSKEQGHSLSAALIESELHPERTEIGNWPVHKVGELVTSSRNGRSIAQDTTGRADGAVLTLSSVHQVNLALEYQKLIVLPDAIESQFSIELGDVFVSRANTIDLVGLASVAEEQPTNRLIYPDLLIKLEVDQSKILPRYLAYSLRSASARKQIRQRALGSSQSMVKISGKRLKEIEVPVPSLEEQAQIIGRLDIAHKLTKNLAVELESKEIEALRRSILRKAFAGKL